MLQKTVKNILWYGECSCLQHWNHLFSWERITQTIGIPSRIQKISQWNKCSTYLRNWCLDEMRSMEWKQMIWKTLHGSICLRLVMNKSSVVSAHRSTYFQILYCVLVRYTRTSNQTLHGNKDWRGFEWNIFPGFNSLQLSQEVQELLLRFNEITENFTGRIIFMSMFNDISCGPKDNKIECESNAQLVSLFARRFGAGQWSFLGPGSDKEWYSISEDSPQGEWDKMAEKMMLTFGESKHPVFRSTSPLSRGQLKSKDGGKLSLHYCANQDTITTVFEQLLL